MKIAVVSLKFSPGHIAHLRAYRELFLSLEAEVSLFLVSEYRQYMADIQEAFYIEKIEEIVNWNPALIFIYNISISNLALGAACKKKQIQSVYILHEPRGSIKELLAEGHDLIKAIGADIVNDLICKRVDKVLLASQTGMRNYSRYMKSCNRNYALFPLIFTDEYDSSVDISRKYFSFIGAFTGVHARNEFLKFMEFALAKDLDIQFLIATKNDISAHIEKEIFRKAIQSGKLTIQSGRPMTTGEINRFYRQSICVWNAYNRSTQSGVLANALMQGTPVIVNDNGAAKEAFADKSAGCFINMPPDSEQVYEAYIYIQDHLPAMEQKAREVFKEKYFYKSYVDLAKEVILT